LAYTSFDTNLKLRLADIHCIWKTRVAIFPANSGQDLLVARHIASEEPNATPDAKRNKTKGFMMS
jgi:hypothetical protein